MARPALTTIFAGNSYMLLFYPKNIKCHAYSVTTILRVHCSQLLQQISSYIFKTSYRKVINVFPLHTTATSAFTAKRTTNKNPAKQNIIYTLTLYTITEIMVTHYHKQRASKGIHVYMRARVVSQGEGCGFACEKYIFA